MASKFGLASGIPERRVRPIWDAVDSRKFRTALKPSFALLTKYPSSPYAVALKALILERMGKPDEAMSICLNAKDLLYTSNMFQVDEITLSTMQIVFQRLDHLELVPSCYEHAGSKHLDNVEALMGFLNCYVQEYSYVKQQLLRCTRLWLKKGFCCGQFTAFCYRVFRQRIKISSYCALKHCWVLWDNAFSGSQIMKTYLANVDIINFDASFSWFNKTEESLYQS